MVLRKPYAFLIKHFKFIHILLTMAMIYLIYRTEKMIDFLNGYIESNVSVMGKPIVSTLFDFLVILLPILILVISIILLVTMAMKKKPKLYYILMIVVHLALIAVYLYGWIVFGQMEETIVDMRTIKALRDLLLYCILFQGIFSMISLVRGVGFDIKKFDFGHDLEALDISEEDNEEFEIAIDFDLNDKTRQGRKLLRYMKYQYLEHKTMFHLAFCVVVVGLGVLIYSHFNIYSKTNREQTNFDMNGFVLGVNRSYLLNDDYKGNPIQDGTFLVVVEMNLQHNGMVPSPFATGNVELYIADDVYHHTNQYDSYLSDLGVPYTGQNLGNDSERYLFVYAIPVTEMNSKMELGFSNADNGKTAYVRLNPIKLYAREKKVEEYALGETIQFKDSTLGEARLQITNYELRNRFEVKYRYCTKRLKECLDSVEYLMPNLYNSNYDKTLLKLDANFSLDGDFRSSQVKDLYTFIQTFGKIEYEMDGQTKTQNVYLGSVKSTKVKTNSYYIEVFQEMKAADKIALVFQVRDNVYRYYLK